jgi:hypothetical protein
VAEAIADLDSWVTPRYAVWSAGREAAPRAGEVSIAVRTERRPYHLYPLLGLVLVAAMAIGLYYRIKYPPRTDGYS